MKQSLLSLAILAAFIIVLASNPYAYAQNNPTEVIAPASSANPQQVTPTKTPNAYLDYLYAWLLGLVGLAALFAIVYGGVLYIFSGAIESTANARRWITNALIGLIIASASYLILRTINPDLVRKFDIQSIIEKNLR